MFQSTHPHGVRPSCIMTSPSLSVFQSTHPHGVRRSIVTSVSLVRGFNPRTHTGCDGIVTTINDNLYEFQSTHPHGVRLGINHFENIIYVVSIHAPTRGATIILYNVSSCLTFQSTHPHGVRPISLKKSWRIKSFNPRTHTGCDHKFFHRRDYHPRFNPRTHTGCDEYVIETVCGDLVSIHAPTRGATHATTLCHCVFSGFNPRTHTGCDSIYSSCVSPCMLFQSTHPHGVRLRINLNEHPGIVFQSTHPHGVRPPEIAPSIPDDIVSIHAPTRGATRLLDL